jgi:N-acetylneuraminic acid mutarotase
LKGTSQGTWIQKADFGGIGRADAAGFAINGKGYIGTGGEFYNDLWEYDPTSDIWSQKANLPGAGRDDAFSFSISNKGYLGTGQTGNNSLTDDVWEYDPQTNSWSQISDFGGGKRQGAYAFSLQGKGYVGSGSTFSAIKKDLWEYDPISDTWTPKSEYPGGEVGGNVAFTIADKAYVGTGRDITSGFRKDFWEYDPTTDLWIEKAAFAGQERTSGIAFAIDSFGYLGLGYAFDTVDHYLFDFWQYNRFNDSWAQMADYPGEPGHGATGFAIDSAGYIGTGRYSSKGFWEFIPDTITAGASIQHFQNRLQSIIFPNPVTTASTVIFSIGESAEVDMDVFDISGRKVETLLRTKFSKGTHQVLFQKKFLSSGIYVLQVRTEHQSSIIKFGIE